MIKKNCRPRCRHTASTNCAGPARYPNHPRYFKTTGQTRNVSPRIMEYLGHVIDTPTDNARGKDNGKAPDEVIGQKMSITRERIRHYRVSLSKFTKEEIMELCEDIMKEAS